MKRVAITGIGLATALGVGTEETWNGLIEGRSGVGPIRGFNASSLRTQLGAEILDFAPQTFVTQRRTLRMMTRGDQLALVGAIIAMRDAGLTVSEADSERAGLFVGGNKEVSDLNHLLEATLVARNEDGTVDLHRFGESAFTTAYPLFFVEGLQAGSLFYISQTFGLKGANAYFAGTADAGATAIGSAYRAVRRGEADVAIAGGFDDAVSWWSLSKFDSLGMMTDRNDLGAAACRPFDRDHSGSVLGEGAAFLVLEDYEAAVRRGARIYAELTGYGHAYDNYKLLTPHPEGRGLARALQAALRDAGSAPEAIGYVAAHGCGTELSDISEARALRGVFGAAAERLVASSVKPATGHLVAAAGALNAAVAALATYHQLVPPTLNFRTPAPDCDLDWVPGEARPVQIGEALAVARGMEGQNVALAMRAAR